MSYDFDKFLDRTNTNSIKWDRRAEVFGREDVLPMWVADMDFEAPREVIDAIVQRAEHGVYGYTDRPDTFYGSIIDWVKKRHGWDIKSEWLGFSPGIVTALSVAVITFTKPGDKVLVQSPVYHPFFSVIQNNNRTVVENPLVLQDSQYVIDFDDLEEKLKTGVKMMLLCNPHNPIGRVWTKEELNKVGQLCLKNNVLLVSDEIHSDIIYSGNKHIPVASISQEMALNTITCMAPSKTFNIAGLATSVVIIPNDDYRKNFINKIQTIEIGMTNIFGIVALEAAYRYGEKWLQNLIGYLEGNIEFLMDYVKNNMKGVKALKPQGTYLVWMDFRELGMEQKELKKFLIEKAGVGLNDGTDFGENGRGFMRLNIGCPRSTLREGLKRIRQALDNL